MEELRLFQELNLIKSNIDNDLSIIKNLEYDSKIKSINQYNKQLYNKLNNQENIIEEGKIKIEKDSNILDKNFKNFQNEINQKNLFISELDNKINLQNKIILEKDNYIRQMEGS